MKQLTIATYNIRHGCNVRMDWNRLGEIIRMSHADMVGIQEVDMLTNRTGGADTIKGLTEATGLPYALYIPAMDFDGGQYGTAILSRYPITFSEIHPLESGSFEPRAFGAVTVSPEEGLTIHFLNTHLSYESTDMQNVQFGQLAEWMEAHIEKNAVTVLTGDFNTEDFTAFSPLTALGFSLINRAEHTYKTFRSPPIAIDNIVYRTARLTPVEHGMIDSDRSDHNLLWCRFDIH
jgi:endonuclease/exonuclease/phosphatase family metal-dependent hydrolase